MVDVMDFPARGKVIDIQEGKIVFNPTGMNYELHLAVVGGNYAGPSGVSIEGTIRVTARKLLTVPSGGNFIAPIFGTPRTIQGRVRHISDQAIVIHAGTPIVVELPPNNSAFDLANGPIGVGSLVNISAMPGATFELFESAKAK